MKISYINSVCVANDAISNAIRDEISWLKSQDGYEVKLFASVCDDASMPFVPCTSVYDIALDPYFQQSDLIVFHFGIYYSYFNLLVMLPQQAKSLVIFHNITPKQYAGEKNYKTIDKSFKQMANITFADHVACVSQTNLDVLRSAGIETEASILPLAVHSEQSAPQQKPSATDGVIRLIFIGRFVAAKGVHELITAIQQYLQQQLQQEPAKRQQIKLDLIGNLNFSDQVYVQEIKQSIKQLTDQYGQNSEDILQVNLHGNASESLKQQLLQQADIFVLPTYHEGFCVPILEAIAAGCQVIAYNNSNTPAISGGLATLVNTGDVPALCQSINDKIQMVTQPDWQANSKQGYAMYKQKARQYVQQYQPQQTKQRFINLVTKIRPPGITKL
ncbi:MAG: hypothetical protein DRQ62_13615 [Gammaproteobacteria bacterium]|nr:MAG: hypothetical protein DRQ62_13615 [Gammaproteobacteria bacterium]